MPPLCRVLLEDRRAMNGDGMAAFVRFGYLLKRQRFGSGKSYRVSVHCCSRDWGRRL
jgi:hypothetical protein